MAKSIDIEAIRVAPEPGCAALCHWWNRVSEEDETMALHADSDEGKFRSLRYTQSYALTEMVCVFDWGGDCSICLLSGEDGVTVLATIGSNHNGGEDVDRSLTQPALLQLAEKHDLILAKPIKEMSSDEYRLHSILMREVKIAKEALCNSEKVRVP